MTSYKLGQLRPKGPRGAAESSKLGETAIIIKCRLHSCSLLHDKIQQQRWIAVLPRPSNGSHPDGSKTNLRKSLHRLSFCSVIGLFCLNWRCCWPYCCWSNWINLNLINNQNLSIDNGCYGVCVCSVFDSDHHYWWMIINWDSLQLKCRPLLHWAALGMSRDSHRTDYGRVTKCWYRHWMLISINIFIMKD